MSDLVKYCSHCHITKSIEDFYSYFLKQRKKMIFQAWCKACMKEQRSKRKPLRKSRAAQVAKRKREDVQFRIATQLRIRLAKAVRYSYKAGSAVRDLGCSIEKFKAYLETKFQPGMSWANWSTTGWHIDHIRPLSSFDLTDASQFKQAVHYTNLQPLWWLDNLRKGKRRT